MLLGPPSTPVNLRAEAVPKKTPSRSQSIELTWDQRDEAFVEEYIVEMRPKGVDKWIERDVVKAPGRKLTLNTENMEEFKDYEFRLTAKNKAGKSKPSEPSNPVQLGTFKSYNLENRRFDVLPKIISIKV